MSELGKVGSGPVQWTSNDLYEPSQAKDEDKPLETYKASSGMMSGEELLSQMGRAPKKNWKIFGGTVKVRSEQYKNVLENVQNYQKNVSDWKDQKFNALPAQILSEMKQELQDIIDNAKGYDTSHSGKAANAGRVAVMKSVQKMAEIELSNINNLGNVTGHDGKHINLPDVLTLMRGGVTDFSNVDLTLNDKIIDQGNSVDNFGEGKVNSVSLIVYGDDPKIVKSVNKTASHLLPGEATSGFDKDDMRTAARNVASANVANLLGVGDMVPEPKIVIHNGQAAIAMELAPGESLVYREDTVETRQNEIDRYNKLEEEGQHALLARWKVTKDEDGNWVKPQSKFLDVPFNDTSKPELTANVQKALLDMQALDVLTGQLDRQPENIFLQFNGNEVVATGIDNDISFGKDMTELEPSDVRLKGTYGGPPPLMSREMYNKISNLTEDQLRTAIGDGLTDAEVDAAVSRLELLQEHAEFLSENGRIVDDFETWTGTLPGSDNPVSAGDFIMGAEERSYIQRGAKTLSNVENPEPPKAGKHNLQ